MEGFAILPSVDIDQGSFKHEDEASIKSNRFHLCSKDIEIMRQLGIWVVSSKAKSRCQR